MLLLRNSSISSSISSVMLKDWGSGAGGAAADGVGSDGFTEAMGLTSTAGFGLGPSFFVASTLATGGTFFSGAKLNEGFLPSCGPPPPSGGKSPSNDFCAADSSSLLLSLLLELFNVYVLSK